MNGSIFYNFWAALFSFAVYFIWAIQDPYAMPWPTIGKALVFAAVGYVAMYVIRYFMGYVFYTPEAFVYSEIEDEQINMEAMSENQNQFVPQNERSTVEFEEDNTEEIAKVVRTMLHGQDEAVSR